MEAQPPYEYRKFPIAQIKASRSQARKDFNEPSLIELTQSIKEEGLIQPITVRLLPDGTAELVAGERRVRAVKRLGWTEIDAKVYPVLQDQEAAVKGLIENLQREDLNALERAQGYQNLADQFQVSHDQIAKKLGMSNNVSVSRHLALLGMPQEIQDLLPRGSITEGHCRSIRQIPDKTKQIELAVQGDKENWSVKRMEQEVKKALGKPSPGRRGDHPLPEGRGPAAVGVPPVPVIPDPMAEVWRRLKAELNLAMEWEVKYGPHEVGPGISLTGWFFFMCPARELASDMASLLVWFEKMWQGLKALAKPEDLEGMSLLDGQKVMEQQMALQNKMAELAKQGIEMAQKYKSINQKAADLWLPKTPQEAKDMEASPLNPRLPNTPAEWAEVEALAPQGPGAVYRWMLGEKSYWTKKASKLSWQDLESSDPITGCHKLIDSLRQGQAALSSDEATPPAPKPPAAKPPKPAKAVPPEENPLLEGLDPETRALLEEELKKGPLI